MEGWQPLLALVLLALAVTALVAAAGERWTEHSRRTRLLRRVGAAGATGVADSPVPAEVIRRSRQRAGRWLKLAGRAPFLRGSGRLLQQAGLEWTSASFARLMAASALGSGAVALLAGGSPPVAAGAATLGLFLPRLYVRRRGRKRLAVIEEQLPEAIELLSRGIRSGHALTTALRMVADESPEPLASEFRRVFDEQKYGLRFEESLARLTRRVELVDLRVMVTAILVQREVGGNLAEILDNIGQLVRTRFMLRRQVRVYTAQGRMSGWVLGALPLALALLIHLLNPDYIQLLFTDPAGRVILAMGVTLQLLGYFWISRVLKLEL